jgi:hypothetical protein
LSVISGFHEGEVEVVGNLRGNTMLQAGQGRREGGVTVVFEELIGRRKL